MLSAILAPPFACLDSMKPKKHWLRRARMIVMPVLSLLVIGLVVTRIDAIKWHEVAQVLASFNALTMAEALGLAALSLLICSAYDLFGRHYIGHKLPKPLVMRIAFVGYVFTLNLGSLIGGMGFRFRLYTRFGLSAGDTGKVIVTSVFTNWAGYVLLAGLVFSIAPPHITLIPLPLLRVLGPTLLLLIAGYLTLCFIGHGREWEFKRWKLYAPPPLFALLQLAVSSASWLLIVAVIHRFMPEDVSYAAALVALLASAIAGVVSFVPGGLGVLESVFIALMGSEVPANRLLGALIAYRMAYYFIPFALAILAYLSLEWRARRGVEGLAEAGEVS